MFTTLYCVNFLIDVFFFSFLTTNSEQYFLWLNVSVPRRTWQVSWTIFLRSRNVMNRMFVIINPEMLCYGCCYYWSRNVICGNCSCPSVWWRNAKNNKTFSFVKYWLLRNTFGTRVVLTFFFKLQKWLTNVFLCCKNLLVPHIQLFEQFFLIL